MRTTLEKIEDLKDLSGHLALELLELLEELVDTGHSHDAIIKDYIDCIHKEEMAWLKETIAAGIEVKGDMSAKALLNAYIGDISEEKETTRHDNPSKTISD